MKWRQVMSERLHVLIVEDNPADADMMRIAMPETGPIRFHSESVARLSDALARLATGGIDIVLTDLGLPDSQGLATFRKLRQAAPGLAIIVLTGNDDQEMAVAAVREGAQDFLIKGQISGNMIVRAVRYAIERKRAEEEIARTLSFLESTMESTADGIMVADGKGGITLFNVKFREIWGITEAIIASKDDNAAISFVLDQLKEPEIFLKTVRDLYGAPEKISFDVLELKDGRVLERYSQPQRIGDSVIGRVWSFRDVTQRKQAEAKKAALEAQNRQLQKAESLGRMAGAIAHYFNNQLGVVIGNLELAMVELPQGARPYENITSAMEASNKAAKMSGLMLTYLGQSFDKREAMDLSDACLRSLPMLQAVMPENVVMETDLPSPGPIIMANTNQIQQVMTNLITNAREAAGDNRGTIHLSVRTVSPADIPASQRFPIDWQPQDNAYACLEVKDAGAGIADKDIEKLFDPFFSSKFTGRGMGLAVVMGIVRAHSGVITVESKSNRGSTFRVFFPVSVEEEDKAAPSSPAVSPRKTEVRRGNRHFI